jgi:hypothetical protein
MFIIIEEKSTFLSLVIEIIKYITVEMTSFESVIKMSEGDNLD